MTKNGIFSKNSIFKLILNFFLVAFFFGFWKILYKYFILNTPETFFWYVQGEEVEFIRTNSTSAPCIYQKTTQIRAKTGHLKKSMKSNSDVSIGDTERWAGGRMHHVGVFYFAHFDVTFFAIT